jgi:DNA polymerase I
MSSYREAEGIELLQRLYEHSGEPVAVDTETTGLHVGGPDDYCIGVSIACVIDDEPYKHYFAVNHQTGQNIATDTLEKLKYVLEQDRLLIFANVQFDILSLETVAIYLQESNFIDICTMAHLANENWPRNKGVESLANYYLHDKGKIVDPFIEAEKRSGNKNITPEQMFDYAVMDAVTTYRVWYQLLEDPVWKALPEDIWPNKQELIRTLITMRRRGVLIDQELCQEYIDRGEAEMKRLARELGYPAIPKKPTKLHPNPDPDPLPVLGPKALAEIFLDRLKLPVLKKSDKTGKPSFDKEVMGLYDEMLERMDSPEAKLVKDYRGWQKAVSASYKPYLELVDSDGRLRCSYKTHGTVTGRLSSSEPNLQQIPKESNKPWNGKVKHCFIGKPGYTLVNADFSQLELRTGTAYADEKSLKQVFLEGRDIFTEMSVQLGFDRQTTKTFVYSTQYGAGEKRIMSAFGVTRPEARKMLARYRSTYPAFQVFSDMCKNRVETTGRAKLWNGRYRHFEYASDGYKAMNSVIQGGAADIMERVMVRCFRELDNPDCQMLLQVHDSITWEVRTELVDFYIPKIKAMMEDIHGAIGNDLFDDVKFAVDVGLWVEDEEKVK